MLAAAALLVLPVAAAELTLMQREYGDTNAGLDDGEHCLCLSLALARFSLSLSL